jgi:tRNA dimethylallyltransferase
MPFDVLVITGPTASGKTSLGISLAKQINGEIVSADSMQIYKYMNIGTAKPTQEEMDGIPHHMIDIISPFENYSVSRYVEDASKCIEDIISRGKFPIIVGGTGLYIESLLSGRSFAFGCGSDTLRRELSEMYDNKGGDAMLARLREFDAISGTHLHPNDKKRIIRAFEVYISTGKTISQHNIETKRLPPRYSSIRLALSFQDRETLYDRINFRVDMMLKEGLISEVQQLLDMGLTENNTSMQAIGYKELTGYINHVYPLENAVDKIKMESRRYAKRQLSWLGRDKELHWIFRDKSPDFEDDASVSTEFLERYGIIQS